VAPIDPTFCFYDDPDYVTDADRDSRILQRWHQWLWSKDLPDGRALDWQRQDFPCLTHSSPLGTFRVSSDTIATTHARYARHGVPQWDAHVLRPYERAPYTIGAFIVFPRHALSLNQGRGSNHRICDRFDLTLECIRRHYLDLPGNPLGDILAGDANFFGLFGTGQAGFAGYTAFFHLKDLVDGDEVRWITSLARGPWDFDQPPLPRDDREYTHYLEAVTAFVRARGERILAWCDANPAMAE
jgi:hypothetical protein